MMTHKIRDTQLIANSNNNKQKSATATALTQLIIIKIDAVRELTVALPSASLLQENWQMLQHRVFDLAHILGPHPILRSLPAECLCRVLVLLGHVIVPQCRVDGAKPHHDVGVIPPHPSLVVHPVDVELLASL